jgi:hypothetical protein
MNHLVNAVVDFDGDGDVDETASRMFASGSHEPEVANPIFDHLHVAVADNVHAVDHINEVLCAA